MALTKEDLLSISYLLDVKLDTKFTDKLRPVEEGISDIKSGSQGLKWKIPSVHRFNYWLRIMFRRQSGMRKHPDRLMRCSPISIS